MSRYGVSESTSSGAQLARAVGDELVPEHVAPASSDVAPSRRQRPRARRTAPPRAIVASICIGAWPRRSEPSRGDHDLRLASSAAAARSPARRSRRRSAPGSRRRCAQRVRGDRDLRATSAGRARRGRPRSTPSAASASASRVTSRESSANVSARRDAVLALPDRGDRVRRRARAQRWTQLQARLRPFRRRTRSPTPARASRRARASHGRENSSPRSSTTAGQNRSGSSDREADELAVVGAAEPAARAASRSRARRPRRSAARSRPR